MRNTDGYSTGTVHYPHWPGCEACAPMSADERERLRAEAAARVIIKRAIRRAMRDYLR